MTSGMMAGLAVAGAGALAGGIFYTFASPRFAPFGPEVRRGDTGGKPRVAITFDDGPHPRATPLILDALAAAGVKAAFFLIGCHVKKHPQLVKRIVDEGHLVANHSFHHHTLGSFGITSYWLDELRRTDAAIFNATGLRPALFRPPMGLRTHPIHWACRKTGHKVITWTRRGLDGVETTPEKIIERLVAPSRAGDIVVLHDGVAPNIQREPTATLSALSPLITGLRDQGLELVRLDELIGVSPYVLLSSARLKPR